MGILLNLFFFNHLKKSAQKYEYLEYIQQYNTKQKFQKKQRLYETPVKSSSKRKWSACSYCKAT
jgi:hypothetical protein